MRKIEKIGIDPVTGRDLYFLELQRSEELPSDIKLSSAHFVCLIAWDSEESSVEEISVLIQPLLRAGCCYFCVWGRGCERVHNIIDDIVSYPYDDMGFPPLPEDANIMTTGHKKETLEQALFFFLGHTWPDVRYEPTCKCSIAISIGSREWPNHIRQVLDDRSTVSVSHELEEVSYLGQGEVDLREINQKYSLLKLSTLANVSLWVAGFCLVVWDEGESVAVLIFSAVPIAYIAFLYCLGSLAELLRMRRYFWVIFALVFWIVGAVIAFLMMRSKVMDAREFAFLRRTPP